MSADELNAALHAAIGDALTAHGRMPVRWLLVADTMGGDGERALDIATSPGLMSWDSLGMLDFVRATEHAEIFHHDGMTED